MPNYIHYISILCRLYVPVCVCVWLSRKEMPRLNDDYEHLRIDAYVQEYRCKHFRHKTLKCHVDADVVAVGRGRQGRMEPGEGALMPDDCRPTPDF